MLLGVPVSPPVLFGVLFVWGGVASGIYPVALSMAGDQFRGGDLVSVNAAMIVAYTIVPRPIWRPFSAKCALTSRTLPSRGYRRAPLRP